MWAAQMLRPHLLCGSCSCFHCTRSASITLLRERLWIVGWWQTHPHSFQLTVLRWDLHDICSRSMRKPHHPVAAAEVLSKVLA